MALVSCTGEEAPATSTLIPTPVVTPPSNPKAPYDLGACKTCLAKTCTPERVRCFNVAGCTAISNCSDDTNCNAKCIQECSLKQSALGRREWLALSNCEFEAACGDCNDLCGQSPLCVLKSPAEAKPAEPRTCRDCMTARCPDALAKCEPGTACAAYYACTTPCPEPRDRCVNVCNDQQPVGRVDGQAAYECAQTTCKAACVY